MMTKESGLAAVDVLQRLVGDSACLTILDEGEEEHSDLVAVCSPINIEAATIELRISYDYGIDILLGTVTSLELPEQQRYYIKNVSLFEELEVLFLSTINGGLTEILYYSGEKLRSASYVLEIKGRDPLKGSIIRSLVSLKSRREVVKRYQPYKLTPILG